ncbi:hypothetical protein, conserved in T. vivax [Trypanosoma vivax Y486]|uniref:Trypanosome variant surface glycoprotein A-type N-terminal domain-containing protein n=1 Tax=Trypanosoma vivax (strain Y486) TaxID=1055687 RepID=F9WLF4_TRYVY|nr:hypothetical protein, conserved in T. vivax [Trypanosoma vivax Y486]|eukprot:CCD18345.1 hypothetical protein, conserved in T. vivax [Trypanosoma vivax Y486]
MRWNFAQRGTDGNGATGVVAKAKAHIEATLKQAQSKATEARGEAERALNAAVTLARKAQVQAGKIDGMVDMLATWNSGRQTESNGAAMCLADTVGSVQKWTGRNSDTGKRDTAAELLKACGYDWAPGKEQPPENKDLAETAANVVADLANTGTSGRTAVPNTVQSTDDDTCPLFYGPTTGYGIWLDAANKPYVRLGGLWALKGTGSGLKISLEGTAGRDTMTVPDSDEPVNDNAAQHPVIAKLIEEQKAVKEALAGRQGVDAKVAECHRLLDTNTTNESTPSTAGKNVEAWLAWITTRAGPWTDAKVTPTQPRQASSRTQSAEEGNTQNSAEEGTERGTQGNKETPSAETRSADSTRSKQQQRATRTATGVAAIWVARRA